MKPDPVFVCCSLVSWGPSQVAGSIVRHCNRCFAEIHVAPTTSHDVKEKYPWAELLCTPCFLRAAKFDRDRLEILDAQWSEVLASLRKKVT